MISKNGGKILNKITRILLQIGILLGFLGTLIVNMLSVFLPINGYTPAELSDALVNFFVPAGLTFMIWNLIYVGLLALTIYSIKSWFIKDQESPEFLDKMGIEFILASLANIAWIFFWHYQIVYMSLVAMLVLLGSLMSLYIRLGIGENENASHAEKWFVHIPISIYFGWITIATVANITALFVDLGWDVIIAPSIFWEVFWTILIITVATIITILTLWFRKDIAYSLVVIWSLAGIIIKRATTVPFVLGVVIAAGVSIALILAMISFTIYRLVPKKEDTSETA